MLPGPGQELLSGRLGLWRYDNEGCRYLFLAGFWDWRDTCVGDRRVARRTRSTSPGCTVCPWEMKLSATRPTIQMYPSSSGRATSGMTEIRAKPAMG